MPVNIKIETFLADENFDLRLVDMIRKLEHKVHTIVELNSGIADDEVLQIANDLNAIILTEDKDFGELTYRLHKNSCGVVLLRLNGVSIYDKIKILEEVIKNNLNDLRNSFTVINKTKVRINKIATRF